MTPTSQGKVRYMGKVNGNNGKHIAKCKADGKSSVNAKMSGSFQMGLTKEVRL